jgi:hypothetical protein|tara:strand:- start:752 stop:958 length:207 start_codon:yes stop_codon:yes gene_type:complete
MNEKELHCHYSDLPSPSAYVEDMDYDGMGNQGRFPPKKNQINKMKNFIKKIQIWRIIRNLGKSKNRIL